ncbi:MULTISPECIES: hypothetical protein [Sorangium]|uniref:hypothetical protein n=1 Tax=Sorangium TaxID=39643 RepID=UPI001A9223F4|nr:MULTISPECIES: hypothetical protein [Sorangium]WCQ93528.1 hypothetical protein NQZ70_06279 [Sorangium sp. Soce836]
MALAVAALLAACGQAAEERAPAASSAGGGAEATSGAAGGRTDRRLRLTRLEGLDADWAQHRRFVSPYHWAPQRWGYNASCACTRSPARRACASRSGA